ncbi:hypothetical protein V8E52_011777 [Russula decolorans]
MRTFNFTLLAMLSYVAVIGATPLGARSPAEAIDRRQYILTTRYASPAKPFLTNQTAAWTPAMPTLSRRSACPRLPIKASSTSVNPLSLAKW